MISTPRQPNHRILVIEDDRQLNEQVSNLARKKGYQVDSCFDGQSGLIAASKQEHQLMLLDLMLPKTDGITLLNQLRKTSQMPVIILTAKGAEEERITGFQQGADDYIAKPFNSTELILRMEALLRRSHPNPVKKSSISIDGLHLDASTSHALIHQHPLELTSIQFQLLWELSLNHKTVLSKAHLSQHVLNRPLGAYDRGLDMHLSRIRRKLNDAGWQGDRLQTVHGKGYCLK